VPRRPCTVGVPEGEGAPTTQRPPAHPADAVSSEAMTTPRPAAAKQTAATEQCLRCGAAMEWRHGTFQCPRCRFKIGCCEGLTGECSS
jgi:hypothetical protein